VADARVECSELVLDLGAGTGRLTDELARTGARVWAIELDAVFAASLRRRFAATPNVRVMERDLRAFPLPCEPFRVVANVPFGVTTAILRRLLDDPRVPLTRADVIVEWDLAKKRAACWPSTLLGVCWGAWYELTLVRRLPRGCFEPAPSVDAAVLRITRRPEPLVPIHEFRAFEAFVRDGFERGLPEGRGVRGTARRSGIPRHAAARELDVYQWSALFEAARDPAGVQARRLSER
jgi:23S rRNA (adenine-N6)-dimethyltransferase